MQMQAVYEYMNRRIQQNLKNEPKTISEKLVQTLENQLKAIHRRSQRLPNKEIQSCWFPYWMYLKYGIGITDL